MAQHIARLQRWNVTIVKVKVRSTNCGASDAQNAITRIKNSGVVDPFDTNLSFSLPTKRFHKFLLKFLVKDRKSTRLNSSHLVISYAVFCLKKKKTTLTSH